MEIQHEKKNQKKRVKVSLVLKHFHVFAMELEYGSTDATAFAVNSLSVCAINVQMTKRERK